jgi:hypothetical protein
VHGVIVVVVAVPLLVFVQPRRPPIVRLAPAIENQVWPASKKLDQKIVLSLLVSTESTDGLSANPAAFTVAMGRISGESP